METVTSPLRGSALRFALVQDRALSVDGIAGEDRMDRLHLVPTQVGDQFSADRTHAPTAKQCERETRIHRRLLSVNQELSTSSMVRPMLEHIARLEIFIAESRDLAIPPFTNLFIGWQ